MPKLLLKFETAVIKEIKLDKPSVTLGRKPDNDIVLDHPTISGHHCKIYSSGGTYFVEDLNSTNGTFVNGKKVMKAGIHSNDVIGIVKYSIVFTEDPKVEVLKAVEDKMPRGFLQVLEGAVDKSEYEITSLSTYIGKSDQANIPIKGSGLFGSAPDMAVMIAMRPEGFYLIPIKEDFAKLNGSPLTEKIILSDDDTIEVGATKFRFSTKPR